MSGPRLSIIPARAATDRSLKPRDLQVLCVLGRHTNDLGWCRRSQVKMADEMGCARSTVFEAIERLVKGGYLERHEQEEVSGRDSAHWYRVILDPVHPNVAAVEEAEDPCRLVGTPADIPAPPAGPEPAPPAGPGPAPINDPYLTTPLNVERERGREDRKEEVDNRKAVAMWLKRVFPKWPTYVANSDAAAMRAALELTDEQREAAADRMAEYLAIEKAQGGKSAFSVYLTERRWERLGPKSEPRPAKPDDYAPPFGPSWMCWVVAHCLTRVDKPEGSTLAERWPLLDVLYRKARLGQGYRFGDKWRDPALLALLEAVPVGSARFIEWEAHFMAQGWPWIPDPGKQPVVFFPVGGPGSLHEFERTVRGGHDGDRQQAAE